jgi:uncharacterized membrane protein
MAVKDKTTSATSTNLAPNLASALCYAPFVGLVVAIVLFIVEKNTSVKWNAVQALLVKVVFWILMFILPMTIFLALLVFPLWIVNVVLDLVLAVKAYRGNPVKLPVLADWTDKILKKV